VDPPIRFCLMASASNPRHGKSKAEFTLLWTYSAILPVLCFLSLAGFYFLGAFLDNFFDFGRFDLFIQSRSGPKDSLLTRKSKV